MTTAPQRTPPAASNIGVVEKSPDVNDEPNFEGHAHRTCGEHRTVGPHRAWCFDHREWCYPDEPCAGCVAPTPNLPPESAQEAPNVQGGHLVPTSPTQAADGQHHTQESASRRGRANGQRGKRAERDLVTWLRVHGWPGAERTVRTGYRTTGRTHGDHGDIDGTPGLCWQIKDVAERSHSLIPQWTADTERQRIASGADIGILVIKRRGHADPGDWWAHVSLIDVIWDCDTSTQTMLPGPLFRVPIRLAVADLTPILKHWGYGSGVVAS